MKLISNLNVKGYLLELKQSLDSRLALGQERFTGWVLGNIFSVSYYSGKEFGRRNYPIFNKVLGFARNEKDNTEVRYVSFKGITDPISVLLIYLVTTVILLVIQAPTPFFFSLLWTLAVAALTFAFTCLLEIGQEGEEKLINFIRNNGNRY